MPYLDEVSDITAYAFDSKKRHDRGEMPSFDIGLDATIARLSEPPTRWPVRNREERGVIPPLKRAIIHERDGNICRICGTGGHVLTVDHIIPRSAFTITQLRVADRSDNLISACWDCNMQKSNYEYPQGKRLGVAASCWECVQGLDIEDWHEENPEPPEMTIPAHCGKCGTTRVPDISWIL